ncbi:thioredoxin family protein [Crossiella sp. CA-258035]|uniref:TlpA family protein disulfide reductase n=1 Tax=Crossiella sp. CA-258035 TaxID=2981138 RepID=UPI0024BD1924|nr:thioredoxin family protein [Crossiella sp. CA-258035]WHT19205.1 thioredoxin family protein [Crossiella sp. CA-258035]
MTQVWVVLGVLALTGALGLLYRWRNGKVRTSVPGTELPEEIRGVLAPAPAITLVQLSTTFCAPCRHTKVLLGDVVRQEPRLHHVELDVTERPELAERLKVMRTPTTLVVDANERELFRISGLPKRDELLNALRPLLD